MKVPSLKEFKTLARQGNLVPVYKEIMSDLDTPVSAYLKVAANSQYAFLLESVQGGEKWGRYSFLGLDPAALFTVYDNRVEIKQDGKALEVITGQNPMAVFEEYMDRFDPVSVPGLHVFMVVRWGISAMISCVVLRIYQTPTVTSLALPMLYLCYRI